ncbi:MBL fold metallo-hydrolase [Mesorhizobium sp. M4B.F.Ca.ET.215.01.1.1]|uniref:MBL fold metallo-hydrolase n=1 Tax=unclassified Mesorhizobium TaxID=325217 RepID=UPI000FCC1568|nr:MULTISPECIES: MBL fold metallo-hydrolase [unclassified Mesorhizobium]TGQ48446.1 MBL fold metallo-hydrolase [Mesorhizobium sp. M00.F.Ca.ET.220.01.1.1]RUW20133.1 MBL fold metallo-hydrolase [Mesorhizobium sp. M4B.F.Ca.ET.013.02.1.1]RVD45306.1 MBL fold metallo-hydrolase [Mesorhizobium sp. M4B.F.Ca.ET.019.03.1.1]TGQ15345.1 MBL fold metallo-hydrolase [Mesorhizobium sp. M4B.F.Ca.ET.215.01.1.1]TGR11410.1 MBL fold metallo-hydrolase [Mesorhizobium sp. M4B.F.Ca.ET.203.01.1.1]
MERISAGLHHTAYKIGGISVTSLRDGYVDMPIRRLRHPGDEPFGDDLPSQVPLFDGALRLSVNAFAIDDGQDIMLIDTGSSNAWHPTMGLLPQALSEARIAIDRVRTVAFTHTHLDHIHGIVHPDGRDGFPQLTRLLVPRAELDMFRSVARLSRFHDRAEPLDPGQRLSANVEAVAAPGHEIGHTCFRVTSDGGTLLVWGDLVHVPSLQFDRPEVAWEFDANQEQARASRLHILALAADNAWCVAGAHLDSPGVGRIFRTETAFRFEPL